MFDPASFVRVVVFAVIYAGVEYRYVNRYERESGEPAGVFSEKAVFWKVTPYHVFLLLPMFIAVSFSPSISAWAGNTFFLAVVEDIVYFLWRGKWVRKGEWTTTLMGSLGGRSFVIPSWWPLDTLVAVVLFWAPF